MVTAIAGVLYVLLVCPAIAVPPVGRVYQRYCPAAPPAAVSIRLAAVHDALPVVVGAAGGVLMVAITAVQILSHVPLLMAV